MAEQLGEFGEIRITRTEPETVVEWEGERASGTVRLEASGWGTRVTITAEVPEPTPATVPEPTPGGPVQDPGPVTVPEPTPDPVPEPTPDPVTEPTPDPVHPETTPDQPETAQVKDGFFKRLFGMKRAPETEPAPEPEPILTSPEPEPTPEPEPIAETPEPEPIAETLEPEPQGLSEHDALKVLTGTLDHLGAAHHRPFSRG